MILFFFFQAEDGIRDSSVTGVQTCALPIWRRSGRRKEASVAVLIASGAPLDQFVRSEERRVGKGVDLGGRRIIKKKKKKYKKTEKEDHTSRDEQRSRALYRNSM